MEMGVNARRPEFLTVLFGAALMLSPLLYVHSLFQPSDLPRWLMIALAGPVALLFLTVTGASVRLGVGFTLALLLLGWSAVTIAWTPDPGGAYVTWMQWLSVALCAFAIAQRARSPDFLWALVTASVAGGTLVALIGFLEDLGVPSPYRDASIAGATFYVKNHAALYLDAIAPVAIGATFMARDRRLRWFFAIAAGLTTGYLMMSRTRGSWLALTVVAVTALWACRHFRWPWREAARQSRNAALAALCIALAVAAHPGAIGSKKLNLPINGAVDRSSSVRLTLYANTLPMIAEHPWAGVGLDGWPQSFRDHYLTPRRLTVDPGKQEQRTHSDPLQLVTELGIPGGLLALALLAMPLRRAWSLASHPSADVSERGLRIALGFGLLAVAVHGMVDFPLHKPSSLLQYAAWGALVVGSTAMGKTFTLNLPVRAVGAALALCLLTVAVRDHLRFFEGSERAYFTTGAFIGPPMTPTPCTKALQAADDAVKLFPEYFVTHVQRVRVHAKCSDDNALITVMSEELEYNPTNAEALLARGTAFLRLREFDQAEADFRGVLMRFDYDGRAWAGLAELYQARGDVRAAQEAQRKAETLNMFRRANPVSGSVTVPDNNGKL